MSAEFNMYLNQAVNLTKILICISCGIATLEWLCNLHQFKRGGIFDRRITLSSRHAFLNVWKFFSERRFLKSMLLMRIVSITCLIPVDIGEHPVISTILLTFILISHVIINRIVVFGLDGSDQMTNIVIVSLIIIAVTGPISTSGLVAVAFVACQSIISYTIAGVAKFFGRSWRKGIAVPLILSSETYGKKHISVLLMNNIKFTKLITWLIMLWEASFVLSILDLRICIFYIFVGIIFHSSAALMMGLNTFFWSFISTYPCIIILSLTLSKEFI